MSERARILPFNSSAFVGRPPLMAVPQTGDRLLPVLARVSAGLKIGFPSLNNSRHRHSCIGPSRVHLRACGCPLLASARSAPASPRATACRSCAPPSPSAYALLRRTRAAPSARLGHFARYCSLWLLASVRVPHLPCSRASRTPGLPLHPSQCAPVPALHPALQLLRTPRLGWCLSSRAHASSCPPPVFCSAQASSAPVSATSTYLRLSIPRSVPAVARAPTPTALRSLARTRTCIELRLAAPTRPAPATAVRAAPPRTPGPPARHLQSARAPASVPKAAPPARAPPGPTCSRELPLRLPHAALPAAACPRARLLSRTPMPGSRPPLGLAPRAAPPGAVLAQSQAPTPPCLVGGEREEGNKMRWDAAAGGKIRTPGRREQRRRGKEISQGLMRDF
jgi:hypothetical protein